MPGLSSVLVMPDADGLPRPRQVFSRWLKTDVQANNTAQTILIASNRLPVYVEAAVGLQHVDTIGPGSVVRLQTRILQDATGAEAPELFLVVEVGENAEGTRLRLTLRSVGGFPATWEWAADDAPTWAEATAEEKAEGGFWTDENGLIDGIDPGNFWN